MTIVTVKDLREALGALPQDAKVVIQDADTDWYLENIKVSVEADAPDCVVLHSHYGSVLK